MIYLLLNSKKIRSHRLSVRTRGFHPRKRGSIPLGTAKRLQMTHFVYVIGTKQKNRLITYVGYTNDIKKRLKLHNKSRGAKFTRGRHWVLIYSEKYLNNSVYIPSKIQSLHL